MKILSMTATFGKLEHDSLTLKPGLNVIEAPNEWGKSTWCAFFLAMLYGVDTRAKTTKTALADKERYAPWSGLPMSGRMELQWQGKKITIERSTRGRVPMGVFRAYETETGLEIPQLNAENCGEILLGAERSVVKRAGFVELKDIPVTKDDALLARLNALVTTGDESGDGEQLARSLKDLKNRCRYNRKGLLPEAEEELRKVNQSLQELRDLQDQAMQTQQRLAEVDQWITDLDTHLAFLSCQDAADGEGKIEAARKNLEQAREEQARLRALSARLPSDQQAQEKLKNIKEMEVLWNEALEQQRQIPQVELPPAAPAPFMGMNPREAVSMAVEDGRALLSAQEDHTLLWLLGALACIVLSGLMFMLNWILPAVLLLGGAGGLVAWALVQRKSRTDKKAELLLKYGDADIGRWRRSAEAYARGAENYQRQVQKAAAAREELNRQQADLRQQKEKLCGDKTPAQAAQVWQEVRDCWQKTERAEKDALQAESHLQQLISLAKLPEKPEGEDPLQYSRGETEKQTQQAQRERQMLLGRIGQCQGRMEALGTESQLDQHRRGLQEKIEKLEEIYEAAVIALANLEEASAELQRRFAPRITRRAQELMSAMTDGRYQRLTLGDDFTLSTGTGGEDVLHGAQWRSDGTVDQLYLALRLAVWEVLTPEAPLILDDALVRFDQQRLEKILEILRQAGNEKQILLFTCQNREGKILPGSVVHKG